MTWDRFVSITEDILTLAALLGAVWSAVVFIGSIGAEREATRLAKLRKWRKATVQKILHLSEDYMTAGQITEKLKSSSFDAQFDIKTADLNEEEVRLLLIEMITDGVLIQIFGDLYGLKQFQRDVTVPAVIEGILANRAYRDAFSLISSYSGLYDDDRLWNELGEASRLIKSDFILAISDLSSRSVAHKDEHGKWHTQTSQTTQKKIADHA